MNLRREIQPIKFNIGDKVTFISDYKNEYGIVKSLSDKNHIFVVYNCDEKWDNYQNYTAARTKMSDLKIGWL